ncbi:MAG: hypothetical protein EOM91_21385 [Sphingobacteriia bacterium]|nr:hypothetical protein [Sphingobacteriia bacterium]
MNASQQLIEEIARARRLLNRDNEWLNYAVTTDRDEGLHLVVEGNEIKKFEARIGDETIQLSAL